MNKYFAEFLGTFWLVFGGCGSAVLAAAFPELGIGFAGVALAFGLTVLTGAYALGHISGGHFNPAVSVGLWVGGRFDVKDLIPYIVARGRCDCCCICSLLLLKAKRALAVLVVLLPTVLVTYHQTSLA